MRAPRFYVYIALGVEERAFKSCEISVNNVRDFHTLMSGLFSGLAAAISRIRAQEQDANDAG